MTHIIGFSRGKREGKLKKRDKHEEQQKKVIDRMCTDSCILEHYEEWDEGQDMKWILTFRVLDDYEKKVEYN